MKRRGEEEKRGWGKVVVFKRGPKVRLFGKEPSRGGRVSKQQWENARATPRSRHLRCEPRTTERSTLQIQEDMNKVK